MSPEDNPLTPNCSKSGKLVSIVQVGVSSVKLRECVTAAASREWLPKGAPTTYELPIRQLPMRMAVTHKIIGSIKNQLHLMLIQCDVPSEHICRLRDYYDALPSNQTNTER